MVDGGPDGIQLLNERLYNVALYELLVCSFNTPHIDIHIIPGKKRSKPKSPHLCPPPQDKLHHLCYLCVNQYYFDIHSAELPFTNFDGDVEDPMQFLMAHPNIQEVVGEPKKARMYIIEPPDQGSLPRLL